MKINKLLIANRGEIARRVMRTARAMGISTVAVYSEADRRAPFAREADEAVCLGPSPASESYLAADKIIAAAKKTGAQAVHPGYGFLAENADFARRCEDAGLIFVGPGSKAIAAMGSKIESKKLMAGSGVPIIPAYYPAPDDGPERLKAEAAKLGYPVLIKASAGGGGKGMRVVETADGLMAAYESCGREAEKAFGDGMLLIEKYFPRPRHVEFQIFGDHQGHVVHLFERECSIQRRHQKIIEETPSLAVDEALRARMGAAAVAAAKAIGYVSAGTVEFILDAEGKFYFLEMNTRLQVEHPITEMITGLDLVRWQLLVARGEGLPLGQDQILALKDQVGGAAVECRIYAEDPDHDFLPAAGEVLCWATEAGDLARYDTGIETGSVVATFYDPILAKVITHGRDRGEATARMIRALQGLVIHGVTTNTDYLQRILAMPAYARGEIDTEFLDRHEDELHKPELDAAVLDQYAVAAALDQHRRRRRRLPYFPGPRTGFRNLRWRDQDGTYEMPGGRRVVYYRDLGERRFLVTTSQGEAAAEIIAADDAGRFRLEIAGVQSNYLIASRGDEDREELFVHGPAGSLNLKCVPRFPDQEVEEAVAGGCKAPMPGTIVKVLVNEGARVKKHDPLVVMEAMKMEQTIFADVAGRVKEVRVVEGGLVDAGEVLVVLDPASEAIPTGPGAS
jgi:propionyl-CoA carboxylase alpha chain